MLQDPSNVLESGVEVIDSVDVIHLTRWRGNLTSAVADTQVDMLYNNAGIMLSESLDHMDFDQIREQFEVNTLGPIRTTLALLA